MFEYLPLTVVDDRSVRIVHVCVEKERAGLNDTRFTYRSFSIYVACVFDWRRPP